MDKSLVRYIWRHSRRDQIAILVLVVLSLPFYFLSLDLPKTIVNGPIKGDGFVNERGEAIAGASAVFLHVDLPNWLGGGVLFDGFSMERTPYLFALSFTFLFLVLINGWFKFRINMNKGRLGERMLRRVRFELLDRLLRFPPERFRRMKQAEISSMVKDEVEPLGGFIGDAFVQPAFLGTQALTALVFIVLQSFWLGLGAAVVVMAQGLLIPRLRRPLLAMGKDRQLTARELAGRIGEVVDNIGDIHINDATHWERAEITARLGRIFRIRYDIYWLKFFIKWLNNFLAQVTPFMFYALGGWLAIRGDLDIGQLVAVIAAYKDLPGPVRDIINWDQQRLDVQVKYDQVVSQFEGDALIPPQLQDPDAEAAPLTGEVRFVNVVTLEDGGARALDAVSFAAPVDAHVAIVGEGGASRKEQVAYALARMVWTEGGWIEIGGARLAAMTEARLGRRVAYVGESSTPFARSIRDNLLYGLRHRPTRARASAGGEDDMARAFERDEARRTDNSPYDVLDDWVDYAAANAAEGDAAALDAHLCDMLDVVGLSDDVYRLGLNGVIDAALRPELTDRLLAARAAVRERLASDPADAALIEAFDPQAFNSNATILENILFGASSDDTFAPGHLSQNRYLRGVFAETGLDRALVRKGLSFAETLVDIFADLPPDSPMFERFSFISADDLPEFRAIVTNAGRDGVEKLAWPEIVRLVGLTFTYVEARHRLGLVDDDLRGLILKARKQFHDRLPAEYADVIAFYDPDAYTGAATILDNLLFGRITHGVAGAKERMSTIVYETLERLNLRAEVTRVGLDFDVGAAGKRLSSAQRQKLAFARGLAKRPDLFVANQSFGIFDSHSGAELLKSMRAALKGRGFYCVLNNAGFARDFDLVIALKHGRLVKIGAPREFLADGGVFAAMLGGGAPNSRK